MAKIKISAGAEFDVLTESEMRAAMHDMMRSWMAEATIGARYNRIYGSAVVAAAAVDIGGALSTGELGPAPGFVWDVRRLRITGLAVADVVSVYMNDPNPSSLIATTADVTGKLFLWSEQVVLYPGDSLRLIGTGLAAIGSIVASGQVRELPMSLAWRIGG